jgi:O-antigen/teichoic acid export membrane protein
VTRTYRTATAWVILAAWPFYFVCAWTATYWLEVFGHGYDSATAVVVILGASMLLATGCGMVSAVLVMGGRTRDNLVNTVVALVLNVGIDLILIPRIGIRGAAIGWAVSIAANNLMPLSQIWRQFGMQPVGPATGRAALLTLICFLMVPGIGVALASYSLLTVLIGLAIGSLIFFVVVVRWYEGFDLHAFRPDRSGRHRR